MSQDLSNLISFRYLASFIFISVINLNKKILALRVKGEWNVVMAWFSAQDAYWIGGFYGTGTYFFSYISDSYEWKTKDIIPLKELCRHVEITTGTWRHFKWARLVSGSYTFFYSFVCLFVLSYFFVRSGCDDSSSERTDINQYLHLMSCTCIWRPNDADWLKSIREAHQNYDKAFVPRSSH